MSNLVSIYKQYPCPECHCLSTLFTIIERCEGVPGHVWVYSNTRCMTCHDKHSLQDHFAIKIAVLETIKRRVFWPHEIIQDRKWGIDSGGTGEIWLTL